MFICNIHKYLNIDTCKVLLCSLVLSKLDYVNSILYKASPKTTKPCQTTTIFAARLACKGLEDRMPTYVYKNYIGYNQV